MSKPENKLKEKGKLDNSKKMATQNLTLTREEMRNYLGRSM